MLLQSVEKCSVFFTFVQRCYSMLSMVNIVVQLFVHLYIVIVQHALYF